MANCTVDEAIPDKGAVEVRLKGEDTKLHTGPVRRLLAKVSKMTSDYTEYKLDNCDWRRLSLR